MRNLILFLLLLHAQNLLSQTPHPLPHYSVGAYSRNFTEVFSVEHNSAALAETKWSSLGVTAVRKYLLQELNGLTAAGIIPLHNAGAGVLLNYFGSANFNCISITAVYGRRLSDNINLGAGVGYAMVRIPGYISRRNIEYGISSLIHLNSRLHFGIQADNPLAGRSKKKDEDRSRMLLKAGLGYEVSGQFLCGVNIVKGDDGPADLRFIAYYRFHPRVYIRAGAALTIAGIFCGLSLEWEGIRMDLNIMHEQALGLTPQLGFLFNPKKKGDVEELD